MSLDPCPPSQPQVIIGEDATLVIQLKNAKPPGYPFDITAASEIIAILLNADGTALQKKLSTGGVAILNGPAGALQVLLAAVETALLAPSPTGSFSDLELHVTIASKLTIVQFPASLQILNKLFPAV